MNKQVTIGEMTNIMDDFASMIAPCQATVYITRTDAAKTLGVSPGMISAYIKGGKLKGSFKLGRAWAIPLVAVEELMEARPEGGFKRGRKKK